MEDTQTKRSRGRPPKFPASEVRERLIDAGIEALRVEGVDSGLDAVVLDATIAAAGVPRGMAYRIWQESDRTPQEALRHDVVLKLLSLPADAGLKATRELLASELEQHTATLSDDQESRRGLVSELVRTVGAFNHEALNSSEEWRLYCALRSAAMTRPDVEPEMMKLLKAGEDRLISEYAALYTEIAKTLGWTLRENFTIEQFAATAYALNEGLSSRLSTNYQDAGIVRSTPTGGTEEWVLFCIGLEALVTQFFEL